MIWFSITNCYGCKMIADKKPSKVNHDIIHITENKIYYKEVLSNPIYLNLVIMSMNNDLIVSIIYNYLIYFVNNL